MKKFVTVVSAILLIVSFGITAFAENSDDFIEQCRANHTDVFFDSDVSDEYSAVTATGFDALWDDRTLVTEEDILRAETYNNEEINLEDHWYERMQYGLKLRIVYFVPYTNAVAIWDGEEETRQWTTSDKINNLDASLMSLCTSQNIEAHMELVSSDRFWYVVSIEKYDVYDDVNEELSAAACDSQMSYEVTFPIPSKYSESTDLKLAKIDKGQVSYMEDIDSDEGTYTIRTNGSAVYVFVGTANETDYEDPDATDPKPLELIRVKDPKDDTQAEQTTNPSDNNAAANGTVSAAKTADAVNITWLLLAAIAAGVCIMLCAGKKCEE